MGKLVCKCGHVMRDSDPESYRGGVLAWDDEVDRFEDQRVFDLREFLVLTTDAERRQWIAAYFGADYPTDGPLHEIAADLTSLSNDRLRVPFPGHAVMQCVSCGRVWAQSRPGSDDYETF